MTAVTEAERKVGTRETVIPCVTQDPHEANLAWASTIATFRAVCTTSAVTTANSIYCPTSCGGHPICGACLALSKKVGLLR